MGLEQPGNAPGRRHVQQLSNGGASRQRYKWVTSELTVPSTAHLASPERQNPLIWKEQDLEGT